ncbi:MAG: DMT family transporter [Anaerolineales bacterium]
MVIGGQSKIQTSAGGWLVIAAAILWGTSGTAQAFAPEGTPAATVGAVRLTIGGIALMAIALSRGVFRDSKPWRPFPTLIAALSIALYQLTFFMAVSSTGVAIGTIVSVGSAPIVAGFLGYVIHGNQITNRWIAATLLAVVGCSVLLGSQKDLWIEPKGILLALIAGSAYATYVVFSKRLLEEQPPDAVLSVVFCLGALFLLPWLITHELDWLKVSRGLIVALHLGLIATALSYTLFIRGLKRIPAASAVTLSLAEPLMASILGIFILGERFTTSSFIGAILVLSGLIMLSIYPRRDARIISPNKIS